MKYLLMVNIVGYTIGELASAFISAISEDNQMQKYFNLNGSCETIEYKNILIKTT